MRDIITIEGRWGDKLQTYVANDGFVGITAGSGPCSFAMYFSPADAHALAAALTQQADRVESAPQPKQVAA